MIILIYPHDFDQLRLIIISYIMIIAILNSGGKITDNGAIETALMLSKLSNLNSISLSFTDIK